MNVYIVSIKNYNELITEYVLDLHGEDFTSHKNYVLDMLIKDYDYLGIDVSKKYNLDLLSINFRRVK